MSDANEPVVIVSQTLASRIEQIEQRQEEQKERMSLFFFVCLLSLFVAASSVLISGASQKKTEYRLEKLEEKNRWQNERCN